MKRRTYIISNSTDLQIFYDQIADPDKPDEVWSIRCRNSLIMQTATREQLATRIDSLIADLETVKSLLPGIRLPDEVPDGHAFVSEQSV